MFAAFHNQSPLITMLKLNDYTPVKLIQEIFPWYYHSDKLQITNGSLPIGPRTEYLISSNELFCAVFWSPVLVSKCPGL